MSSDTKRQSTSLACEVQSTHSKQGQGDRCNATCDMPRLLTTDTSRLCAEEVKVKCGDTHYLEATLQITLLE